MSKKEERLPWNPYPMAVYRVKGISPTAQSVLACLGVHTSSTDMGATLIGKIRLQNETKFKETAVKSGLRELFNLGRISREKRPGGKWGSTSSRTRIWLTAEEIGNVDGPNAYPVKTLEEIAAIGKANQNESRRRSKKYKKTVETHAVAMQEQSNSSATYVEPDSKVGKQPTNSSQGSSADQLIGRLAPTQGSPDDHNPTVVLPFLGQPTGSGFDLAVKNSENSNPTPFDSFQQGKKENQDQNQCQPREGQDTPHPARDKKKPAKGPAPRPKRPVPMNRFKPEVESQFRAAGAPDLWFEAMAYLTDTIDMLNGENLCGCPHPIKSYLTICRHHPDWKAVQIWTPKMTMRGEIGYSEASSLADQIAMKRMNDSMTDAEREQNAADWWWGKIEIPERKQFGIKYVEKGDCGWYDPKGVLEAYRLHGPKKRYNPDKEAIAAVAARIPIDLSAVDDI